jgi:hypothetical protein
LLLNREIAKPPLLNDPQKLLLSNIFNMVAEAPAAIFTALHFAIPTQTNRD